MLPDPFDRQLRYRLGRRIVHPIGLLIIQVVAQIRTDDETSLGSAP